MDLSSLNPQQKDAVLNTLQDNTVLIAGAGSGKTKTVQVRTGYLIEDMGVDPSNIMVVTFTNKAANEIKMRLLDAGIDLQNMWVGTFHSICVRALRQFGNIMGIDNFTIMDKYDAKNTLKSLMTNMSMSTEKYLVNKYLAKISWCKSNLVNPAKIANDAQNPEDFEFAKLYKDYQDTTWRRKSFDFDDLIVYTVIMLSRCPSVRQWFEDNVKYITIDESQDTNAVQFELVKLLAGNNNLFLVGDDAQSIYKFRNARPEYLLNFQKYYPYSQIKYLEENFRSTKTIVKASNGVIKHNQFQYDKNTFSNGPLGDPIIQHQCKVTKDEADWIAFEIKMLSATVDYKNMAILYRTNAQSRALEEALMKHAVPYKIWGSLGFYDRKEIRDIVAYLRLKGNEHDETAFKRILSMQDGIGKKTIDGIMDHIQKTKCTCLDALSLLNSAKAKHANCITLLRRIFVSLISTPSDFLKHVLAETDYLNDLVAENTPDSLGRVENIQELEGIIGEIETKEPGITITELINKLSLATDKGKNVNPDSVNLMTMHMAKGLEFEVVFLVGVEEGILPHSNSYGDQAALEEERRLMYVGITRAKKQLYITNCEYRRDYSGNNHYCKPSRFIAEIPNDTICTV